MIKISAKKTKFRLNNKSENPNFSQAMLTLKRVEIKIFSINKRFENVVIRPCHMSHTKNCPIGSRKCSFIKKKVVFSPVLYCNHEIFIRSIFLCKS